MRLYSKTFQNTTRAAYARAAVFEEFRPRDAAAIDYDGFVDRKPHEAPAPGPESWRPSLIGRDAT